jgi:NADH pyrophosphatase NudC (nudix superfamily)
MEINFCRRCGASLQPKGSGAYQCSNGHTIYQKDSPAVSCLLLNSKNEVLLSVRDHEPNKGTLDIPGGFCDPSESFDQALVRELQEELSLEPSDYSEPKYLVNGISNYPYEGESSKVLGMVFWCYIREGAIIKPGDDVADVIWVPLKEVDFSKMSPSAEVDVLAIRTLQKQLL